MFDNNWNILITVLVIVLIFAYFRNCTEGFAINNDEAIANVASLYNKDNMTVTNLSTTGSLNSNGTNTFKRGILVTDTDPGTLIGKNYGNDPGDRYGIGQYSDGRLKVYSAGNFPLSHVALSLAKKDGGFEDRVLATTDGVYIGPKLFLNGDLISNNNDIYAKKAIFNGDVEIKGSLTINGIKLEKDSAGNLVVNGKIIAKEGVRIPYEKQLQFGRSGDNWLTVLGTRTDRVDLDMWRTAEDGVIRDGTKFLGRW